MSSSPGRLGNFFQNLGAAVDTSGQTFNALQQNRADARRAEIRAAERAEANANIDRRRGEDSAEADAREKRETQRVIRDRLIELCQDGSITPEQCEAERAKLDPDVNAEVPSVLSQPNENLIAERDLELADTQSQIDNRVADNASQAERNRIANERLELDRQREGRIASDPNAGRGPRAVGRPNQSEIKLTDGVLKNRNFSVSDRSDPELAVERNFDDLSKEDKRNFSFHVTSRARKLMAQDLTLAFDEAIELATQDAERFLIDNGGTLFETDDLRFDAQGAAQSVTPTTEGGEAGEGTVTRDPVDGKEYIKVNGQWVPTGR